MQRTPHSIRFVRDAWLHRVSRPEGAKSLARRLNQMKDNVFLEIGYEMIDRGGRIH
ncbi:MAG: hypothetical protein KDB27_04405 [Planctomycetales bacterium]|nr:hypothetical protein [Planctomycetales bacterium]